MIALAAGLPLLFAAFTQHAWEDYFITLRASRNLVEGNGLVFNAGQRLHTFTSPLGVLLPALCTWLAGPQREELALWLFRFISVGFLGAAAWLVWRRAETLRLGVVGRVTLFGLLFTESKLIDFSINGMETALLVFFVLLLWSELESTTPPRIRILALAVAGLMWTRPDAFVIGGALLLAHIALRERATVRQPVPWKNLLVGIVAGGALYVPWFAWAWWYYGTPVPHTIIAKGAFTPPVQFTQLLLVPWQVLTGRSMLVDLFLPTYSVFGGWPSLLTHVAHALTGIAAFAWLARGLPLPARRASLALFIGMFYVCSILLFPWYVPPWTVLAVIALAFTSDAIYASAVTLGRRGIAASVRVGSLGLIALQLGVLGATAWQMRAEQQFVETDGRRRIGEWLKANAAPGDTVFLEPLGYIGYFSQLKTYDFPGLSSPEVVAAVKAGARRYADVIAHLRPAWVVLRPSEVARPEFSTTGVLRDYEVAQSWDKTAELDRIRFLPGRSWVEGEAQFVVFRRKPAPSQ